MTIEKRIYDTPTQKRGNETGSETSGESMMDRGAEAYGKAEKAVSDAYDKTSEKVSETYEKAKSYSSENPGTTILIALGIGVGLGLLLGASTHRSSSRFAQPVVHALSDIASELFR